MFQRFGKSVLAKMIAIFLLMAFLLVGVLGYTIFRAVRQESLNLRYEQLSTRINLVWTLAKENSYLLSDDEFDELFLNLAQESHGVIFIANRSGRIINEFDGIASGVSYLPNKYLDPALIDRLNVKSYYLVSDYYNKTYSMYMSTAVKALRNSSGVAEYYVVIHFANNGIDSSFARTINRFWIPCIAVIGLCVVMIILLNYSITTPLVEMNSIVYEIKRGNYSKRALVTSKDEVGQLAESFNAMAEELEKTDTMSKDFVANISHELRTPLTSINGFIQGILDGTIPQDQHRKYLEIVLNESQRLTKLTREMLDLSRIESGKYSINKTVFDINELLRRVLITLENKIDAKKLDINIEFEQERTFVLADSGCIEQVCVNLIDNAIKFTDEGKNISITTKVEDGSVRISIADSGKGISKEDMKHIWDRFYTENKSRSGNIGMGLGLPIVKRLLAEHGRDIIVESELGVGTRFTFELEIAPKNMAKN